MTSSVLLLSPGLTWNELERVCTQLDVRCDDAGEMVAKAQDLVAAYTKVSVFHLHTHT